MYVDKSGPKDREEKVGTERKGRGGEGVEMREPSNSPILRAEGVGKAVTPTGHHVLIKKPVIIRVKHS